MIDYRIRLKLKTLFRIGEGMKKFTVNLIILLGMLTQPVFALGNNFDPIPPNVKLPAKYTNEYIEYIKDEYKDTGRSELIYVAIDMLKGTDGDFSRKALIGNNLSGYPVKIEFRDLSTLNKNYANFDAIGWKRKDKLCIYINPKHRFAPPGALAALLSHEALHQDEYNSLSEETYAWTMEAAVWSEIVEMYPESNQLNSALVQRENTLKQLFEKGGHTNQYIKKAVYANTGYQGLPLTSPGFQAL